MPQPHHLGLALSYLSLAVDQLLAAEQGSPVALFAGVECLEIQAQVSELGPEGAHALSAAAYAAKAAGLASGDDAADAEISWQLDHMSEPVRAALRRLPLLGEDPAGPLGAGLLASGILGSIIRKLQAGLAAPD